MLARLKQKVGVELRDKKRSCAISRNPGVVEGYVEQRARREALPISKIYSPSVLKQRRHARGDGIRLRNVAVLQPKGGGQSWIERVNRWANTKSGRNQSSGACTCSSRSRNRAASSTSRGSSADSADTRSRCTLNDSR